MLQVFLLVVSIASSRAGAVPITLELTIEGGPTASMLFDGTPTLLPNGLIFLITVDTATIDTWAPADFGLFPAISVSLTAPDLALANEAVDFGVTPLAYFEDESPTQRAGIAPLFPSTGIQVGLPSAGNGDIGNPNVLDTISTMNMLGTGFAGASNSITFVSGQTLSGGTIGLGSASLITVPESNTSLLLGLGLVVLSTRRRWRNT